MIFEREDDARRVETVLPKRLSKYGLRIHPEKTRLILFVRPGYGIRPTRRDGNRPGTFDFLGFTHYWARSRKGNWVVMQKTAAKRLRRAFGRFDDWCREHRHDPLPAQREMLGRHGSTGTGWMPCWQGFPCHGLASSIPWSLA
jgi:hypothetical protein